MTVNEASSPNTGTGDSLLFDEGSVRFIHATANLHRVLSMSQPSEPAQASRDRRRRGGVIILLIAIAALLLGLGAYSSLNPQIRTVTQQQFVTTTSTTSYNITETTISVSTVSPTEPTTTPTPPKYGYPPSDPYSAGDPILQTAAAPALASPGLSSGAITVLYAEGTPLVLSMNHVTLKLCAASCVSVNATLNQIAPGTYAYTFTPPASLTGTVTTYLLAGTLADNNGKIFPSVTTHIGTYEYSPSTASGTSAPIGTSRPPAGTPVNQLNQLTRQAVNTVQTPTQTFPIQELLAVLSALHFD